MKHLTIDELVDLAEGARTEASAPHLRACAACRQQLGDLRATMSAIGDEEVPEPSPLFWDHFSARVHDAVAAEGAPSRRAWAGRLTWRGLALPLAALAAAIVVAVVVTDRRSPVGVPVPAAPETPIAAEATEGLTIVPPDDPALDLVADLGTGLDWEEVHDSGMVAHTGLIERAVGGLSADERAELGKLLKQELHGGGN